MGGDPPRWSDPDRPPNRRIAGINAWERVEVRENLRALGEPFAGDRGAVYDCLERAASTTRGP